MNKNKGDAIPTMDKITLEFVSVLITYFGVNYLPGCTATVPAMRRRPTDLENSPGALVSLRMPTGVFLVQDRIV